MRTPSTRQSRKSLAHAAAPQHTRTPNTHRLKPETAPAAHTHCACAQLMCAMWRFSDPLALCSQTNGTARESLCDTRSSLDRPCVGLLSPVHACYVHATLSHGLPRSLLTLSSPHMLSQTRSRSPTPPRAYIHRWLLSIDLDEFLLPVAPPFSFAAALAPHAANGAVCLHLRRHNFVVNNDMHASAPLTSAIRRAPFPPQAPPKGERRVHGLSQPIHPKWILHLPNSHTKSAQGGRVLVANQHSVLDASRCMGCVLQALRAAGRPSSTNSSTSTGTSRSAPPRNRSGKSTFLFAERAEVAADSGGGALHSASRPPAPAPVADATLLRELAALAPFSLEFGADFNDMLALDGNVSNACQFPKKCSLANPVHAGVFERWPPPKQRVLSCVSSTARELLAAKSRLRERSTLHEWRPPPERCWRPVCLAGERAEASLRLHHYGMHGMDLDVNGVHVELLEDRTALQVCAAARAVAAKSL